MNTKAVKSFGLALMLAAGVIAVLLAMGTFSPQKAAAQTITDVSISPSGLPAGTGSFFKVNFTPTVASILPGEEIVITIAGFQLPSSIDASNVNIRTGSGQTLQQGAPANINVDADKGTITLLLPKTLELGIGAVASVTFLRDAGIKAPLYADADGTAGSDDTHTVKVKYSASEAEGTFTTSKAFSIDPTSGDSDTKIKVSGAGYPDGALKVFVTEEAGTTISNPGQATTKAIVSTTVSKGAFEATIDVSKNLGDGDTTQELNEIWNGSANFVRIFATGDTDVAAGLTTNQFTLKGKLKIAGGNTLVRGTENVKIDVSEAPSTAAFITQVKIGDRVIPSHKTSGSAPDAVPDTIDATASATVTGGKGTIYVDLPSDLKTGAKQTLELVGGDESADSDVSIGTATVEVTSLALDVTPTTAVQGTRITLTGSGFKPGGKAGSLVIATGEKDDATTTDVDESTVTISASNLFGAAAATDGRLLVSFDLPDLPPGERNMTLTQAGGRVGEGKLTVPMPAITVDPASGKLGSAITITGSNFPGDAPVFIDFGTKTAIDSTRSDSSGSWSRHILVPPDVDINKSYDIRAYRPAIGAVGTPGSTGYIRAQGERAAEKQAFKVPGADITLSATKVQSGDTITVTATGLKPYSDFTATLGSATGKGNADSNGDLTVNVLVPLFNPGNQLITIESTASKVSETKLITIVTAPEVPPTRDVETEFADLIAAGVLDGVFRYDNATKEWSGYSPTAPAAANDLDVVNTGDILWIKVNADGHSYGGEDLTTTPNPWNLVVAP